MVHARSLRMATSISHSPAETVALGEAWGRTVQRGLVIGLCGDLGAGKTQLVKGLARGLGIGTRVVSPTFALVNIYREGRLPLFHLDLYRLDTPEQVLGAGLEDYLYPDGVTVVEWAERWFGEKPTKRLPILAEQTDPSHHAAAPHSWSLRWVEIKIASEAERRISYEDISA
jgi:tRNA threonylcarbamoyladenosine biosynthesis protein TsaE